MVLVGRVVVDALLRVATGGVERDLVLALADVAAAALLIDRAEDVEELADALHLRIAGNRVHLRVGHAHKARLRGEIARQAERTHAAAVRRERHAPAVLRLAGREVHVIIEREHLLVKRRVVRHHADGVVVDFDALANGLHRDRFILVGDEPVQLRQRQLLTEGLVDQVDALKQRPRLGDRGALPQHPGNELELRDVVLPRRALFIVRVAHEVEPSHAQPLLVHRVVVQRHVARDIGHADHRVVPPHRAHHAELERIIPRRHRHLVAIGELVIERPAKVKVLRLIGCRRTHAASSFIASGRFVASCFRPDCSINALGISIRRIDPQKSVAFSAVE